MVYTNNIPQGNQQIATTQPLIQANFDFIQTSIGQEHNFDTTDATKTYHNQASMPNQALSPAVPAGTNGVYFVNSGQPMFYDGTTNMELFTTQFAQGSNAVVAGGTFQIIAAGNFMGLVTAFQNTSPFRYQLIQFWTDTSGAGTLIQNPMASGGTSNISLVFDGSKNIMIENGSGSGQTIKWQVFYRAAP